MTTFLLYLGSSGIIWLIVIAAILYLLRRHINLRLTKYKVINSLVFTAALYIFAQYFSETGNLCLAIGCFEQQKLLDFSLMPHCCYEKISWSDLVREYIILFIAPFFISYLISSIFEKKMFNKKD